MGERVTLCTIGFAKKSLRKFIGLLQDAGVTKVIDIRLHNTSQLAGYAKRDDLEFILETFGIAYEHVPVTQSLSRSCSTSATRPVSGYLHRECSTTASTACSARKTRPSDATGAW